MKLRRGEREREREEEEEEESERNRISIFKIFVSSKYNFYNSYGFFKQKNNYKNIKLTVKLTNRTEGLD